MTDRITILTSPGNLLAKRWAADGSIAPYDDAKNYLHRQAHVANITDLSALLTSIEGDPCTCIIRGRYVGDERALPEMRAIEGWREGRVLRRKAVFEDQPLHAIMIDVDGWAPVFHSADDTQGALGEFIEVELPECFRNASYHWQLSNSAGHTDKPGLRAHLWFWLATPYTSAQLKAWQRATGANVDPALFDTIQAHYTANPVLDPGVADPVKVRSGFRKGASDAVDLQIADAALAQVLAQPAQQSRQAVLRNATHADPVAARLFERGMVKSQRPDGGLNVTCPRADLHTSKSGETATLYYPANTGGFREGRFKCMHGHCADATHRMFTEALGFSVADGFADLTGGEAEAVLTALKQMPDAEVRVKWIDLALPLAKGDARRVVEQVARQTGDGLRPLQTDLTDARRRVEAERRTAAAKLEAGNRTMLELRPEDRTAQAADVECEILKRARPGEYVNYAGRLARVAVKSMPLMHLIDDPEATPPPTPQIEVLDSVAALALVERSTVFFQRRSDGSPHPVAVPPPVIDVLLGKASHAAPEVSGVLGHPLVRNDGSILAANGLDRQTGLFLHGAEVADARPYSRGEAADALDRLRRTFLSGFRFASDLDRDAAIAGLVTGVQRRVMDTAPGLAALAPIQASGKTTLIRKTHVVMTGHDMPVATFPLGDEAEVRKALVSLLMCSPSLVCFDNIPDGFTFRSGVLAGAMTAPVFSDRLLGVNKTVTVPTNCLFAVTGNNLKFGPDEVSRWLVCRLEQAPTRGDGRYLNPDVVGHALAIRQQVLRDVVGLVAGYLSSGNAVKRHPAVRHERWDRMVRQPLVWAGGADMGEVFEMNAQGAEHVQALRVLLGALRAQFGLHASFYARDVAELVGGFPAPNAGFDRDRVADALEGLNAKDPRSPRSVGRVLTAIALRPAVLPDGMQVILRLMNDRNGTSKFRLAAVDV